MKDTVRFQRNQNIIVKRSGVTRETLETAVIASVLLHNATHPEKRISRSRPAFASRRDPADPFYEISGPFRR
jgi:hypothetical protein